MSGCGCSFTPVENKETEEIKYTDALAEQFAAEVGVDPRPNETLVEIDERGAFIRQPTASGSTGQPDATGPTVRSSCGSF